MSRCVLVPIVLALSAAPSSAQATGNTWVRFVRNDARLAPSATDVSNLSTEVDFAFGDLDQDGWIDLVVVRKEPLSSPGKRSNVLLMNEAGVLVAARSTPVPR